MKYTRSERINTSISHIWNGASGFVQIHAA